MEEAIPQTDVSTCSPCALSTCPSHAHAAAGIDRGTAVSSAHIIWYLSISYPDKPACQMSITHCAAEVRASPPQVRDCSHDCTLVVPAACALRSLHLLGNTPLLSCEGGRQGPADEEAPPPPTSKDSAPDFMPLEPAAEASEAGADGTAMECTEGGKDAAPDGKAEDGKGDNKKGDEDPGNKGEEDQAAEKQKKDKEERHKAEEAKKAAKPPKVVDEPLLCAFRYFDRTGKQPEPRCHMRCHACAAPCPAVIVTLQQHWYSVLHLP